MRINLKNAVRVAVAQVLVIVLGILGTAASAQWWVFAQRDTPGFTSLVVNWGFTLLVIPALWIVWMARLMRDDTVEEDVRKTAFLSGVVLAGALLLLMTFSTLNVFSHIAEFDPLQQVDSM